MTSSDLIALVVASLGGTAIGLERQWSGHADGPAARFAGIRTFTMLGAIAGLCGWLWANGVTALAVVLLAGAVAFTLAAYVAASQRDVDGTTEAAALVVLASGVLAGLGELRVSSGLIAVLSLLLLEKSRLHSLVRRIDDAELRGGIKFAVMALVVLPLLPEGPYGPLGGVRPRQLWMLVLFFSGLSFAGHLLRRVVGAGHGYLIGGLVGGLVSSTNVTWTYARLSREDPGLARALAFGAVGANAVLYPRVIVAVSVLNPALVLPLLPFLGPPAIVAFVVVAIGVWRARAAGDPPRVVEVGGRADSRDARRNPLQLSTALQMALLFQVVIMSVNLVGKVWGQAGLLTTAAVLGLTDVDALTVSMAREIAPTVSVATAALATAIGVLSNTGLKTGLAMAFGAPTFRAIAGATLLGMMASAVIAILLA